MTTLSHDLPRQLSTVFLRPSPIPSVSSIATSPPAFAFQSKNNHLVTDDTLHSRALAALTSLPSDRLTRSELVAYEFYAERFEVLFRHPERFEGRGVTLLCHLSPIFALVNDFLRERGSRVFYEPVVVEGQDCFVARMPRTMGAKELVDLAVVELHMMYPHSGHPRSFVPFARTYETALGSIWTPTSFIFGTFVTSHGDRSFRVASWGGKEKPLVIPPLSSVGKLNTVGAIVGIALVGENMEKSGALRLNGAPSPGPPPSVPLERFHLTRQSIESFHASPPERFYSPPTNSYSPNNGSSPRSQTTPSTSNSSGQYSSGQYSTGRSPRSPMSPMFAMRSPPSSPPPLPLFPPRPGSPAPPPLPRSNPLRVASPDPFHTGSRPSSPRHPLRNDTSDTVTGDSRYRQASPAPRPPSPRSTTNPASNSTLSLLTDLFSRALNDPKVAGRVRDLSQYILSTPSSVSPIPFDTNNLTRSSTKQLVFSALKSALNSSGVEDDHPGLYKILKGLLKLGMLDEIHMDDLLGALSSEDGGSGAGGNGYRREGSH